MSNVLRALGLPEGADVGVHAVQNVSIGGLAQAVEELADPYPGAFDVVVLAVPPGYAPDVSSRFVGMLDA